MSWSPSVAESVLLLLKTQPMSLSPEHRGSGEPHLYRSNLLKAIGSFRTTFFNIASQLWLLTVTSPTGWHCPRVKAFHVCWKHRLQWSFTQNKTTDHTDAETWSGVISWKIHQTCRCFTYFKPVAAFNRIFKGGCLGLCWGWVDFLLCKCWEQRAVTFERHCSSFNCVT